LSSPERLDVYLSKVFQLTRAKVQNLLRDQQVLLNGNVVEKAGTKVRGGEHLELSVPPPKPSGLRAENIPLEILYEDKALLVINKPPGLVVHPAAGHWEGTLVNALLFHFKKLSGLDPTRPGIVHRLDKDTSGILIIAKQDEAHEGLSRQFKDRQVEKVYQVLVHGKVIPKKGTIDKPIGRHPKHRKKMGIVSSGRFAITQYEVLEHFKEYSLLQCRIETGRTHQIRVHLSSLGHPVVGDSVYGKEDRKLGATRQLLHAWKVKFKHPLTEEVLAFKAPLPLDFKEALEKLQTS